MVCSPDCLPRGAGAPGSAWKVSGSTVYPSLVPQPSWTRTTISIPGLQEHGRSNKNGHVPTMWVGFMQSKSSMILKSWSFQKFQGPRSTAGANKVSPCILPTLLASWPGSEDGIAPCQLAVQQHNTYTTPLPYRGLCLANSPQERSQGDNDVQTSLENTVEL